MLSRRQFMVLSGGAGVAAIALGMLPKFADGQALVAPDAPIGSFEVSHTDDEWHALLSDDQFQVLRREATERPYSSPLNEEHRSGTFACAGCQLPLFSSTTKFDSHTGWPSFWAPLDNATAIRTDTSFGVLRKEVHCRRCGGHLGHVFTDGPKPTGLRYCMNGLAMSFAEQTT
ncbi:peptide-methionine (R)-S-oxide reductase MsrB [Pseudomonas sp. NFR16]|uniref:peptide-methionine (R)-S-oxide reductase MsrB n=1 Tax=Pseudomonas sp. NFR16 TaxID=1566248 RepID=UPI0008ACD3D4|nr:peptide-methionine (R)-S-oxide reductase MsrB [Pseudomonas sp. NFR16]SEI58138.1 peptide-methionine (R)-S-oxide reductase [Pseudomonas sp. NFR16]